MKMYAQTAGWFVFLALIKICCTSQVYFRLEEKHLTAQEGSSIKIKCIVASLLDARGAYWFWMKDGIWKNETYNATIIFSTNAILRPVSPNFSDRVEYIGSPSTDWNLNTNSQRLCSILIRNLTKADSGMYAFRFIRGAQLKWVTDAVNLRVTENPCPITFQEPQPVVESTKITLTCSTLSSCPSTLQIGGLTQLQPEQHRTLGQDGQGDKKIKSTKVSFTVRSQDDEKVFSCQTEDNKDPYLIRNITVTVEYPPRDVTAKISSISIKEGDSVTLTCSANGRPAPTFTWIQNKAILSSEAAWTISSIQDSQSGAYHCNASNKHKSVISDPVEIIVLYAPQVEIKTTSPALVKEGDEITLTCNVKRSNPQPNAYNWFVNGRDTGWKTGQHIKYVQPDDAGSYTCEATNTAGTGKSPSLQITVQYRPRKTKISTSTKNVQVNKPLIFFCETEANPLPVRYSWYRYKEDKQFDSSQWTSRTNEKNYQLTLNSVQRADEACYMCNATNIINTGEDSPELCIKVRFPPTNLKLSLDDEVTEGQLIIISCTVESFPLSSLTLQRTPESNVFPATLLSTQPNINADSNMLKYTVNATSSHAGLYTCLAKNSEGQVTSTKRKLHVRYRPNPVTVEARPSHIVNEGSLLTLDCNAMSYPAVTSFTWMKSQEVIKVSNTKTLKLESVNPSNSGKYSCAATNDIGTGHSEKVDVKIKYAPKNTKITQVAKPQQPDGRSSVELSCSSDSFPPVTEYSWYKKSKDKDQDVKVSGQQKYTVYSDQPGVYHCVAKNELDQRSSDPVELFLNWRFTTVLKFLFLALICLLLVFLLFLVYRHRKKSVQQGRTNPPACCGFLGWWNYARRRDLTNEPVIAEPFRSRDDLLPEQPCRPQAQRRQPHPDSTPAPNITSVYSTVNLPTAQQGPSAQRGGHTKDEAPNYASIHFGNKQKNKRPKAEENVVYAMVSKQKQANKNEPEKLVDYENVSAAHATKSLHPVNYDSDTSEDEVELNYSKVSFQAKAGHQKAGRDSNSDTSSETSSDSSTSDEEEETQYSEVKL